MIPLLDMTKITEYIDKCHSHTSKSEQKQREKTDEPTTAHVCEDTLHRHH